MTVFAYCGFFFNQTDGLGEGTYYLALITRSHGSTQCACLICVSHFLRKRSAECQRVCRIQQRAAASVSLQSKEELLWDCEMEMLVFP